MTRYTRTMEILRRAQQDGLTVKVDVDDLIVAGPRCHRTLEVVALLRTYKREAMLLAAYYQLLDSPLMQRESDRVRDLARRFGIPIQIRRLYLDEWEYGWRLPAIDVNSVPPSKVQEVVSVGGMEES